MTLSSQRMIVSFSLTSFSLREIHGITPRESSEEFYFSRSCEKCYSACAMTLPVILFRQEFEMSALISFCPLVFVHNTLDYYSESVVHLDPKKDKLKKKGRGDPLSLLPQSDLIQLLAIDTQICHGHCHCPWSSPNCHNGHCHCHLVFIQFARAIVIALGRHPIAMATVITLLVVI